MKSNEMPWIAFSNAPVNINCRLRLSNELAVPVDQPNIAGGNANIRGAVP